MYTVELSKEEIETIIEALAKDLINIFPWDPELKASSPLMAKLEDSMNKG